MANDELDFSEINFGGMPDLADKPPKIPPKKSTGAFGSGNNRSVGRPSKASKEKEVSNEIAGILKLTALMFMTRDVHEVYDIRTNEFLGTTSCIEVYVTANTKGQFDLTPAGQEFCDACAAIVVETPFLLKIIESGDKFGNYARLFFALQPLVLTVINNHLHARKLENDNGES